ncbi:hypothetical protein IJI69_00465 [Candidatus Saccharibacteria bacterium]|nr:hypothetical protein [Candidatus Saccharibacteria bacterium]MBQ6127162.1 hypothetical protein [Candidatus Saccharibacteria bacterium]
MRERTYKEFGEILKAISDTHRLCSFREALSRKEFIVLRHDVEFSVGKAVKMAEIENAAGVKSSYFIQLKSEAYNAFSENNIKMIQKIQGMGHEIGLHYRQQGKKDAERQIEKQINEMEQEYGFPIELFSTHRPRKETAYEKYQIAGKINAYSEDFFTKTEEIDKIKVKYISDSGFNWKYGYPSLQELLSYKRTQILIHPFQWAEKPISVTECYDSLLTEKIKQTKETYIRESKILQGETNGRKTMEI